MMPWELHLFVVLFGGFCLWGYLKQPAQFDQKFCQRYGYWPKGFFRASGGIYLNACGRLWAIKENHMEDWD